MPDLPSISEDFNADASGYLAAIQEMINRTQDLVDEVNTLHALIDSLPDVKNIEINITGDAVETLTLIKADLDSLDDRTVEVNIVYKNIGKPEDIEESTQVVNQVVIPANDNLKEQTQVVNDVTKNLGETGLNPEQTDQAAEAMKEYTDQVDDATEASSRLAEETRGTTTSIEELEEMTDRAAENVEKVRDATNDYSDSASELSATVDRVNESLENDDMTVVRATSNLSKLVYSTDDASTAQDSLAAAVDNIRAHMDDAGLSVDETVSVMSKLKYIEDQAGISAANLAAAQEKAADGTKGYMSVSAALARTIAASSDATITLGRTDAILADALNTLGAHSRGTGGDLDFFASVISRAGGDSDAFLKSVANGDGTLLAFAEAAHAMGSSLGAVLIPMTAASFGITGIATAIHLVVMGTFEFLAVFVPAMYAAAAGAAVLIQGASDVATSLKSIYETGESLGPMLGVTQGDMLGLGHSLQIAQNAADPDAYELLGEAIIGVNKGVGNLGGSMGQVTHTTGTATAGISAFGQMGLAVGSQLTKFGAELDQDLGSNMGTIMSVLHNAVADLVEFGEILGNVGHAILNLAADMPGLAEIILKVIDGISELIKWVSELPPGLIAVVMGIEEAYRWSQLAAGAFGLLGRAMALIGTLGIPVIVKIGMQFGSMAASVIRGIAGLIGNFAALTEKVTMGAATMAESLGAEGIADKFAATGAAVDSTASGMVSSLGKAATFMAGPWGAAIMLAVAAVSVLTIFMLKQKSATEQWIATQQQAIATASNFQVLNQVATSMAGAQKLVALNTNAANEALKKTGDSAQLAGKGLGTAAVEGYDAASGAAKELTSYQQQLYGQSQNVIQGAAAISKQYGVSFAGALGLADAANVKLASGFVGTGKAEQQAQLQVQALVLGYGKLDQTGGILNNTMQAINVQAGIQGSKIQQVNSAWDAFLSMATGLTGGYSQLNLDMQQMGNIAPAVGTKIQAFSGKTSMSVDQIAKSLTSFKGQSAQTWQAYNQSLQGAETFTDNLRTAAAAGVVSQGQFKEAIAGVVNQLLPYAKDSSAARSELSVLAQQAGYTGGNSFADLKSWIDKTGGSTVNMGGLIDSLTSKLSNVSGVAKNFAGTLQTDVLGAMAQAAVGTSGITKLTSNYTASLQANGAQAPQTKAAQDALVKSLESEGFNATEAKQLTDELSSAYGNNQDAANNNSDAVSGMAGTLKGPAKQAIDEVKTHTDIFTGSLNQGLTPAIGGAGNKASNTTNGPLTDLKQIVKDLNSFVGDFTSAMKKWPASESTNIKVSGSGGTNIKSSIPGAPSGSISLTGQLKSLGLAGGGVIPGYSPGNDTVPAMLSPGEGILTPQAVRAIGGKSAIDAMNKHAQHFAAGGITLPDVTGWAQNTLNSASKAITGAFQIELNDAVKYYKQQEALASGPEGGATGSEMANGLELYQYLLKNVFGGDKIAAAGATASIWGESTWDPYAQNCVPLTYKVVTTRGILNHWEVQVGDKTPVYNPRTGQVEDATILDVPYHLDAPICVLGNAHWSVICTVDHRWITSDGEVVRAYDFKLGETKIMVGEGRVEVVEFNCHIGLADTFCLTTSTGTWTCYRDEEVAADEMTEPGPMWTGNTDGRGLIGWTPKGTISNAAFEGGMRTQLPAIIEFINSSGDWGVIERMKSATSVAQAASEWGVGVERYGISDVHAEGIALATSFMNSGGSSKPAQGEADVLARAARGAQDAGGWVYPGMNVIENKTGQIERTYPPGEGPGGETHVHLHLNDKEIAHAIFPAIQAEGYRYASRNNGNGSNKATWAPG